MSSSHRDLRFRMNSPTGVTNRGMRIRRARRWAGIRRRRRDEAQSTAIDLDQAMVRRTAPHSGAAIVIGAPRIQVVPVLLQSGVG
jgi:hypothetical protein